MICVPTLKLTFAGAGPPARLGVNDAVNVSLSLYCGVSPVTARLVVPVAGLTVCVSAADVLLA